jgi:hypothetical protein
MESSLQIFFLKSLCCTIITKVHSSTWIAQWLEYLSVNQKDL